MGYRQMSILRKKSKTGWTTIDNSILNDESLSWRAKGLACYLVSKPDNWVIRMPHLANVGKEGEKAVRTALQELAIAGYLMRTRERTTSGELTTVTIIADYPAFIDHGTPQERINGYASKPADLPVSDLPFSDRSETGRSLLIPTDVQKTEVGNRLTIKEKPVDQPSTPAIPWQRQPSKKESVFLHLNARCPAAQRRPIVDALIAVHGLQAIIDADHPDADRELNKMHELACTLHEMKMGVKDIERFAKLWTEKDFRGQKKQRPQNGQFLTFISQQLADTSGFPAEDPGEKAAYTITDSWDA